MAKKKETAEYLKQLKSKVQAGEAIIGTERVMKALKEGRIQTVYVASNCPATVKGNLLQYAGLSGAEVLDLEMTNEELGVFCKKNFFIVLVGL